MNPVAVLRRSAFAWAGLVLIAAAAWHPSTAQAQARDSVYVSIAEGDCKAPSMAVGAPYETQGLAAQDCGATGGWRVLAVSSDERSWLDVERGGAVWTTENAVVYDNPIGNFPNLGAEKIELRMADGRPAALIFRISAQDPDNAEGEVTKLFVVALEAEPTFCGAFSTNEQARAVADDPGVCRSALTRR